jgi:hypothetical protein
MEAAVAVPEGGLSHVERPPRGSGSRLSREREQSGRQHAPRFSFRAPLAGEGAGSIELSGA